MNNTFNKHISNPWRMTNQYWCEKEYRIVGTVPYRIARTDVAGLDVLLAHFAHMYLIEFSSGRLNVGYSDTAYACGMHVIIEADRGMDCGLVRGSVCKQQYAALIMRIDRHRTNKELHPKRIFRPATADDIATVRDKAVRERHALADCRTRVRNEMIDMSIDQCEYQWDMNKLTFFFNSEHKIDFRELVKDLYKEYKVRIWMCAISKSRNHYLRELLEK